MTTPPYEWLQIGTARVLRTLPACTNENAPREPITHASDALPLIAEARAQDAAWVAIPVEHIAPAFFDLASGLAGAVLQKFVNYGVRVAVVGDIEDHLARSTALQAFVRESNRGNTVWFAPDWPALTAMMKAQSSTGTRL